MFYNDLIRRLSRLNTLHSLFSVVLRCVKSDGFSPKGAVRAQETFLSAREVGEKQKQEQR